MPDDSQNPDDNGLRKKSGRRPAASAETIGQDITHALRRSKSFPKTIEVAVEGNEVKLTGAVLSLQDRKTAEETALADAGTDPVRNELDIP